MVVMCCEPMVDANEWGLLEQLNGEIVLRTRPLVEVNPDASAGNVLTGETYDPNEFSVTLALCFCPFCGKKVETDLRTQLNAVTTNTYCVNEKNPTTFDREWKLHVLWTDGTTSQYRNRDEDGSDAVYRKGLDEAKRKGLIK